MKILLFKLILLAGCVVGAYYAGRNSIKPENSGETVSGQASSGDAEALAKAESRIAELKRELVAARMAAARNADELAALAQSPLKKGDERTVKVTMSAAGTNFIAAVNGEGGILGELEKNLSPEVFKQTTNVASRVRTKMAEKTQSRVDFLKSIDTSAMTDAERETHERFIELLAKSKNIGAKSPFDGEHGKDEFLERVATEMELASLAKDERDVLARELARELGCVDEDADAVCDAIYNIIDCTSSGLGSVVRTSVKSPDGKSTTITSSESIEVISL